MALTFKPGQCCGICEIDHLSSYLHAEDAMVNFCEQQVGKRLLFKPNDYGHQDQMFSFYVFTCAFSGYEREVNNYAVKFAEFIKANKLGKVWESEPKKNVIFHPNHSNAVFVWTVDQEAIKAWWDKKQKELKVKRA